MDVLTLMVQLSRTTREITDRLDRALGEYHGLSFADLRMLHSLQDAPGHQMTLGALAKGLGVPASEVLRRVVPLEHIGVVARVRAPDNPRNTQIVLPTVGDTLGRDATVTAREAITTAFDERWTVEQCNVLGDLLSAKN